MNSYSTFSLLFFIRKERKNTDGEAPIFLRITINGKRAEISIKRYIDPDKWDSKANKAKGNKSEIKSLNLYLDTVKNKIHDHHRHMVDRNEIITARKLKNRYLGITETNKYILDCFKDHNDEMYKLIDKEYSNSTYKKYCTTYDHLKKYIKKEYKVDDLLLNELNLQFIKGFESYLMQNKCCHNTAVKYAKNAMKITNLAVNHEWLDKNPFSLYKSKYKPTNRKYLNEEELKAIEAKQIKIDRLETIRDIFLFSCYTGLSYAEIDKLTYNNYSTGFDGEEWIMTERTKTKIESNVPLLKKPLELIDKYKDHPLIQDNNRVFPRYSNQKLNSYLKEIADICGINKNLTFHMARHTFATTITLTKGVSMESVSAMLGHRNIRTTQIYSKIVNQKVSEEMKKIK